MNLFIKNKLLLKCPCEQGRRNSKTSSTFHLEKRILDYKVSMGFCCKYFD